jgi:hypothetical protein
LRQRSHYSQGFELIHPDDVGDAQIGRNELFNES